MSRRRATSIRISGALAAALGASGLLFATSAAAGAAGSTSPTPTSSSCSASTTLTVGSTPQSVTLQNTCPFAPNSSVTVAFQGSTVASLTADSTGTISLGVVATDPTLAFNGGTAQTAVYGTNTVTASGTNASGGTNTATFLIDLQQASSTSSGTGGSGGLAFTGADLAALIAAALALILLGTGVVTYTRRRSDEGSHTA
jgi:hypothetical protein